MLLNHVPIIPNKDELFVLFAHYHKPETFFATKEHLEEAKKRSLVREKKSSTMRALEFTQKFLQEVPTKYLNQAIREARAYT